MAQAEIQAGSGSLQKVCQVHLDDCLLRAESVYTAEMELAGYQRESFQNKSTMDRQL